MEQLVDKAAIEEWPIDRLKPYERNSRQHAAEQIEQIAASIREWGWTIPILADENGMVLAGHGRLLAGLERLRRRVDAGRRGKDLSAQQTAVDDVRVFEPEICDG